ncbi:hypothetical protein L6R50_10860 [Myxococcota bacterium]|nr:hypothetical protein [Myxococcota bacterium]
MTTRPCSHDERDQIAGAMDRYLARPDADPRIRELDADFFAEARRAFQAAREFERTAHSAWEAAGEVADARDAQFERDLFLLAATVLDARGAPQPDRVAEMLGGVPPTALARHTYREAIARSGDLLRGLAARGDLAFDPEKARALGASREVLLAGAVVEEEADSARRSARAALDEAASTFDRSWGKAVRAIQAAVEESVWTPAIPRFVRGAAPGTPVPEPTPARSGAGPV